MLGFRGGLVFGGALLSLGWLGVSHRPGPAAPSLAISKAAPELASHHGVEVKLSRLMRTLPRARRLRHAALEQTLPSGVLAFGDHLVLCPRMRVANAPAADADGALRDFAVLRNVSGVTLSADPTRGACLSSAFGVRGGRMHKGIDLYAAEGGPILAAGDGVVVERKYRNDYGNMLLIDHGNGVFTRYAHLSRFAADDVVGAHVRAGQVLGLMGATAGYRIPVHLHYEVLLGDYDNPRGSFGLTPRSIFDYPPA